jgi:hypothetical protein
MRVGISLEPRTCVEVEGREGRRGAKCESNYEVTVHLIDLEGLPLWPSTEMSGAFEDFTPDSLFQNHQD